ncbi:hypothetical protein STEG23_023013 [Scotinomys teguina]
MALSETNQFKQLQAAMHTDIQALEESTCTLHQDEYDSLKDISPVNGTRRFDTKEGFVYIKTLIDVQ